jgi:hypothetical protein
MDLIPLAINVLAICIMRLSKITWKKFILELKFSKLDNDDV